MFFTVIMRVSSLSFSLNTSQFSLSRSLLSSSFSFSSSVLSASFSYLLSVCSLSSSLLSVGSNKLLIGFVACQQVIKLRSRVTSGEKSGSGVGRVGVSRIGISWVRSSGSLDFLFLFFLFEIVRNFVGLLLVVRSRGGFKIRSGSSPTFKSVTRSSASISENSFKGHYWGEFSIASTWHIGGISSIASSSVSDFNFVTLSVALIFVGESVYSANSLEVSVTRSVYVIVGGSSTRSTGSR